MLEAKYVLARVFNHQSPLTDTHNPHLMSLCDRVIFTADNSEQWQEMFSPRFLEYDLQDNIFPRMTLNVYIYYQRKVMIES